MLSKVMSETGEFRPPRTMTPEELGDTLATLVWETFSDFISREDVETPLPGAHPADAEELDTTSAEEALIFFMWAHTRGVQLAFLGRAPEHLIRSGLDALHRAVFEDMAQHGTPPEQLPIFEQQVSARYAEYHQAASASDVRLGEAVCHHLAGTPEYCTELAEAITERALAVANPLRDFLEDVELVG
ncbi:MAG: hypothetical protein ACE5GJ_03410 [Gemmatimonadota bacterium]